jgi:ribosome-binding protein aMBF1 (putative translation factor)
MEHQDFKVVTFNSVENKNRTKLNRETEKKISQLTKSVEEVKIEADKKLGQILSQARTTLNLSQKDFATKIGTSYIVYSRWESGKDVPTNLEIAKMEKILKVKLPRNKKIKVNE